MEESRLERVYLSMLRGTLLVSFLFSIYGFIQVWRLSGLSIFYFSLFLMTVSGAFYIVGKVAECGLEVIRKLFTIVP